MQALFSNGKIWNREKKQQDMRLFTTRAPVMERSVKRIPSRPRFLLNRGVLWAIWAKNDDDTDMMRMCLPPRYQSGSQRYQNGSGVTQGHRFSVQDQTIKKGRQGRPETGGLSLN
uniref:hypothetical protein n=1 Tax=Aeromonas finlandensis TaxID=1543375 RepID=UPI00051C2B96